MTRIKNYTSGVPVSRTISRIEELLAAAGAKAIGKNYESGRLSSVTFQLEVNGRDVLVRLPANPQAVYDSLRKEISRPRKGTLERLKDQSERTAWKIQQDWLEIELTKIKLNQTEPLQAFLAYVCARSDLESLRFLFRHTRVDPFEQAEREREIGDMKLDVQKNDLPDNEDAQEILRTLQPKRTTTT